MADVISAPLHIGTTPAERKNYLTDPKGLWSWLSTVDHKRIGIMYLVSVMGFFLVGGIFALLIRLSLLDPAHTVFGHKLMDAETYNKIFTLHGMIMVFLFIIPSIPAALGNFVLPLMLGAKDVAFPRLNLASFYYLLDWRYSWADCDGYRRCGYWLDVLHALQHLYRHVRRLDGHGRLHRRVLVHLHRHQLYRHRPQTARAGHGLVRFAAFRLGHVFHRSYSGACYAGTCHHSCC